MARMNPLSRPLGSAFATFILLCLTGAAGLCLAAPPAVAEPEEWIFQGVENDSSTAVGVLFLQRQAGRISGEWRAGGSTGAGVPVSGEVHADGQQLVLRLEHPDGIKTASTTQILPPEDDPEGKGHVQLVSDLGTDREYHFRAVPVAGAASLPRYHVAFRQVREGSAELYESYPQFDTAGPDGLHWKTINARLAEFVQRERAVFLAAVKPLPDDLAAVDPPSFGVQFAIRSRRRDTVSIELTVTSYTGGPRGQASHVGFNYDVSRGRFLMLDDLFAAGSDWRSALATRLNAGLVLEDAIEKGQTPVSPDRVAQLPWTLDVQDRIVFHLAAEALGPGLPEAVIEIPAAELRPLGIVRPDGVLGSAP